MLLLIASSVVASIICQEGQSAKTIPIFPDFLPLFSQFLANVSLTRGHSAPLDPSGYATANCTWII